MKKQYEDFKTAFPTGGVLLNTVPCGEAIVVQAQVFSNHPGGLIGSAQALVVDPDLFEEAEEHVTKIALERAGFFTEVTEETVETEAAQNENYNEEPAEPQNEEEVPAEENVNNQVPDEKATTADDVMDKYAHLMGGKKNKA